MAKIMVILTHGPEHPTRAALAFLLAKTAAEEGHAVSLFLAGDAVQFLRDETLDNTTGVGTGNLRQHYTAFVEAKGKIYASAMSSKARAITEEHLKGKPAEFSTPSMLLRLSLEHDRMFTY